VVHFPIALAILGVPLVLVASLISTKGDGLRWIGVLVYLVLAATAYGAMVTGQEAEAHIQSGVSEEAWGRVHDHEALAEKTWGFGVAMALLLALSTIANPHGAGKGRPIRRLCMILAVIASLATAGWVAVTAHYGGTLVYEFGVGIREEPTPQPPAAAVDEFTPVILEYSGAEAAQVSFMLDVEPILAEHCGGCHGADSSAKGLSVLTAQALLEGGDSGPAVRPGQPNESLLIKQIRGIVKPKMPMSSDELRAEELKPIHMWIAAGAKAN
jgi:uncharacterized membrane protein